MKTQHSLRLSARNSALVLTTLLASMCANATDLEINPVRVNLSTQQKSGVIVIRNNSDTPATIEAKALLWSQADSKDVLEATRELLVTPPSFVIPAHGTQTVRTALRRSADPAHELSYRISFNEIPAPAASGVTGLRVALQVGIPVFVKASHGKSVSNAEWKVARAADGKFNVSLKNTGNAHVQVQEFLVMNTSGVDVIAEQRGATYVLQGQTHEWQLTSPNPEKFTTGQLRIKATTDAGDSDNKLDIAGQ
jgi:fimbrial chaperone protein